jgi:PAS domain S-box-containing protein
VTALLATSPFRSLRLKLLAPLIIVAVGMIALAYFGTLHFALRNARQTLEARASQAARTVNYAAETVNHTLDLQRLVASLGGDPEVTLIVLAAGEPQKVIASTRNEWIGVLVEALPDEGVRGTFRSAFTARAERFRDDARSGMSVCSLPLLLSRPDATFSHGTVVVHIDARPVRLQAARWARAAALGCFLAIALAVIGVYVLVYRVVLRPVHGIIESIRNPEAHPAAPVLSHDELGVLADSLNQSNAEIAESRRELELRQTVLESVIESGISGYWETDLVAGTEYYSPAWKRMLGYEASELANSPETWRRLIHPDDLSTVDATYAAHVASRGSTPYYNEVRYRHKDGSTIWVICSGRVIDWSPDGRPRRMVGCHVDISHGKLAEASLALARAEAEAALREVTALRTALDEHSILSVADRTGRIVDINTGFCRISGYTREELVGQDHRILNSGVHPKQFWVTVWRTIASGRAWRGEVCNRRKDGSLYWVDSTIVPCFGPGGVIEKYVSIRFDITAQKAAEAELVSARVEAQAASAAKSEFLANMSHEIRTPMTAILGYTDLLSADGDRAAAPRQRLEYIETIRRNSEHLLAIINDILDLSKIEAGKMTVEDTETRPAQIVHDVLSLMDVRARAKGLTLTAAFDSPVPEIIRSDPLRLRQILVNLVGNAIKFTEVGSVDLRITCEPSARTLRFEVTDTGIGLTEDQQSQLFKAFVQADTSTTRRYGGTGLGLRICKRLAEILGGDISVRSRPGEGSTFSAIVATGPLDNAQYLASGGLNAVTREALPDGRTDDGAEPLRNVRVLLAEDGPDNQRLITFHLSKAGARVTTADNGRLAVEALTTDHTLDGPLADPPPFDIILTDMQMPELDGYAATRLLRAKGCTLPIVALTAHAMSGDADKCTAAGCDGYASKPINRAELVRLCREVLASRAR